MPLVLESRTAIATPPPPVWGLLVEPKSWKSWWPAVRDARTFDFKPLHEGSRFEVTLELGRLTTTLVPRVSLAAEPKALAWESRWAGVPLHAEWFLDSKPDGSRATARLRFAGVGGSLLGALRFGRMWERLLQEQLRGLKRVAERL